MKTQKQIKLGERESLLADNQRLREQVAQLAEKLSLARDAIIADTKYGLGHPILNHTAYDLDALSATERGK